MRPTQNSEQNTMPEWFVEEQPLPPPAPNKKWRLLTLFIVATVLLASIATALNFSRSACLTAQDYQALTGQAYNGSIASTSSFYTAVVDFKQNSSQYDDSADNGNKQLQKLAEFYKNHSNMSLNFSITSTYLFESQETLMESRVKAVQKTLLDAGVPSSIITVNQAELTQSTDPDEATDTESTTISLTSNEGCR